MVVVGSQAGSGQNTLLLHSAGLICGLYGGQASAAMPSRVTAKPGA